MWIYLLGQMIGAATGGTIVHWVERMHLINWDTLLDNLLILQFKLRDKIPRSVEAPGAPYQGGDGGGGGDL